MEGNKRTGGKWRQKGKRRKERSKKLKFIKRVATCKNSGESSDERRSGRAIV